MGTDIYLSYDGMTEEQKKSQYTGWSCDAGNVGYLRASIGMTNENSILHVVFPAKYWEPNEADNGYMLYDFSEANAMKVRIVSVAYLMSAITGKELPEMKGMEQTKTISNAIISLISKNKDVKIEMAHGTPDIEFAVMWLNSLFKFFALGQEKQREGKNPKVMISW